MSLRTGHPGFSLVELVLVVATMGIMAMIVIPRMSSAADRARGTSVAANVTQLQRSVDLYTAEHADRDPVTEPDGSTTADGATLMRRLMGQTDDLGNPGGYFGPYLRNWPVNAFNGKQSIRIDGAPAGANTHGWQIASATLTVQADHGTGAVVAGGATGGGEPTEDEH